MESTGARLKKIRLEKGISLEEAHKKTKVHLSILSAIEEDSPAGLNAVYIKGFLKIYCKFLGVDPKDYIAGYHEPQNSMIAKKISVMPKPSASFLETTSVKLDFLKAAAKKVKSVFIFILIAIFLAIILFSFGKKKTQKARAIIPAQHSQMQLPKKEMPAMVRLGIRAKEDCWIQLKADGRLVFRTVLKKGKFENWQAKEKMEISLGNAGGVELELNNKPIPVLGRRRQAIKNILITKERGLVVPR